MIIPLIDSVLVVAQSVIFNHAPIGLMFAVLVSLSIFWRLGLWMSLREPLDLW
jgi:hypothetical protein